MLFFGIHDHPISVISCTDKIRSWYWICALTFFQFNHSLTPCTDKIRSWYWICALTFFQFGTMNAVCREQTRLGSCLVRSRVVHPGWPGLASMPWYTCSGWEPSSSANSTRWVMDAGIILCMRPANERRCYNVTSSPIGWAHTQNGSCGCLTLVMPNLF